MHRSIGRGADVLIVGTGPVAAVLARLLSDSGLQVLMLDSGPQMSSIPGAHLRNAFPSETGGPSFDEVVKRQLRPASIAANSWGLSKPASHSGSGDNRINPNQRSHLNLPAASVTNLVGGMGALWNCVSLRLSQEELKDWPGIPLAEWDDLYTCAEKFLHVSTGICAGPCQAAAVNRLSEKYSEPEMPSPRAITLAARRCPETNERLEWMGPGEILGDGQDRQGTGSLRILPQHVVRRLIHRSGKVVCAEVQCLDPPEEKTIGAELFIVAGGAIGTPALLWNSDICGSTATGSSLGRYLYDHPLAYAEIALKKEIVENTESNGFILSSSRSIPDFHVCLYIPVAPRRPFHSLVISTYHSCRRKIDDQLIASLYWYAVMEPRSENRIVFSDTLRDAFGLPQPTFEYRVSGADHLRIQDALEDLKAAGQLLGSFLPTAPPQVLSRGSSMHLMGTTRMGCENDGNSVVDLYGRVWEFSNLFLGGTGLIPCATASNPTLTACALAVRTSRKILNFQPPCKTAHPIGLC